MAFISHLIPIALMVAWLLSSTSNADQINKISANLFQDAFLPCETRRSIKLNIAKHSKPAHQEDHINLILWYRQESSVPFYTIDARPALDDPDHVKHNDVTHRTEDLTKAKHMNNDRRMEFDLRELTPLLRIHNVTEQDEGLYQCRVEYASQRTFITDIRLNVIGAPGSLQITDSKGNPLEGVIGPFNEFESLKLVCTAYGGHPKPSVIWFKQRGYYEEIVDDSYEYKPLLNAVNGTLSAVVNVLNLARLDRNDYFARFLCRAATRFYHPPLTQTITIDLNLLPVNVRIYSSQFPTSPHSSLLIAGQIVEFGCRTDGSKPAANIEWFIDHQRIVVANGQHYYDNQDSLTTTTPKNEASNDEIVPPQQITPLGLSTSTSAGKFVSIFVSHKANSTLSVIRFVPHYTDNGRILSCHAWNPFIANSKIVDKLALDVKYAPHLTIGLGTKHDILAQSPTGDNLSSVHADSNNINNLSAHTKSFMVAEYLPLLELNCHIKANPWIDRVIWFVNGAVITPSSITSTGEEPFYSSAISASTFSAQFTPAIMASSSAPAIHLTNHNQTLRFENVHRHHAAQYQCSARNAIAVTRSETVELNVAYKPQCEHNRTQFVDVPRNVPIQLSCRVNANPADQLTFNWTLFSPWTSKSLALVDPTIQRYEVLANNKSASVLEVDRAVEMFHENNDLNHDKSKRIDPNIEEHQMADESTLVLHCDAENVAGRQESPCAFLLRIVDGPPQKVSSCTFTTRRTVTSNSSNNNSDEMGSSGEANLNVDDSSELTNASAPTNSAMVVQCNAGKDGGKVQTFHLIGLLSASSSNHSSDTKPDNSSSTALDSASESSITQIIQSIQSSTEPRLATVQWNLSSNEAHFELTNVTVNQTYDLIIYADNLVGVSEPLIFSNLLLLSQADLNLNQANMASASRHSWAYLRIKGLIVVLFVLLIMALIGVAIRSYLYTASLYERGTHSLDDVSSEVNEPEATLATFEEEEEGAAAASLQSFQQQFANSKIANQSQERLEQIKQRFEHAEETTPTHTIPVTCLEQQQQAVQSAPNSLTSPSNSLIGKHLSRVKRFLNRFGPNSHYRSYELNPCEVDLITESLVSSEPPTSHPKNSAQSSLDADVPHSHSEQECIDWEAYSKATALTRSPSSASAKFVKLLHWFTLSDSSSAVPSSKGESNKEEEKQTSGGKSSAQLLYVFNRKL